jgi:hypothetical protein
MPSKDHVRAAKSELFHLTNPGKLIITLNMVAWSPQKLTLKLFHIKTTLLRPCFLALIANVSNHN